MSGEVMALDVIAVAGDVPSGRVVLGRRIRELRVAAGLSQRALTHRIGLSAHSNLADYETGRRLPPQDIVISCERVLGLHDGELLRLRRAALAESAAARPPAVTPTGPAAGRRTTQQRGWTVAAAGVLALAGTVAVLVSHRPAPPLRVGVSASSQAPVPGPAGGGDGVSACDDTTTILSSTQMAAAGPFSANGALHPAGTPLGTISLRYSPGCSLGWARFIPTQVLGQTGGEVLLEVHRPSDGALTKTLLTGIVGAESDPLLTTPGCVYAQATLSFAQGSSATGRTGCRQS